MNNCLNSIKSHCYISLIGIAVALFSLTPLATQLEEDIALPLLFKYRGSATPPEEVIIVSIDKISAEILRLPDDPEKWPRSYYAQLIRKLNQQHPAIITFNILFDEPREEKYDQLLAEAMNIDKNIIVSNYLKLNSIHNSNLISQFNYQQIINPIPIIEQAAVAVAPFPIPKTSSTIKQFWTYKKSAGDIATLPVITFQSYILKHCYQEIFNLFEQLKLVDQFQFPSTFFVLVHHTDSSYIQNAIHNFFIHQPAYLKQLEQLINNSHYSEQKTKLLTSWIALLKNPNSLYFNHYGKAKTINSIPFYQALVSDVLNPKLFHNKIVLIGYSEDIEPEKNQGLYTVFSNNSKNISPIEIAATAVANLIDNSWLKPLSIQNQLLLITAWCILLFNVCRHFSFKIAISLVILLNIGYFTFIAYLFNKSSLWLPLFIPVALITPSFILHHSICYFIKGRQNQKKMQKAFSLYIPDNVVNTVSQNHDINNMNLYGELLEGVCVATDAGQYTRLSENMPAEQLHILVNSYYQVMFPVVRKFHGIISDVIGDAMLAIWAKPGNQPQIRIDACLAVLEIMQAVETFNQSQPHQLSTRIGLHFGEIRLGNVGAADHYEYRAVGDTVNTATRIEGLNKLLETRVLVSAEVINQLPDFCCREIGFFILKGKTNAVHIFELLSEKKQAANYQNLIDQFGIALNLFQHHKWEEALESWHCLSQLYPNDGPTKFYIEYITQNQAFLSKQTNDCQVAMINIGNITTSLAISETLSIK